MEFKFIVQDRNNPFFVRLFSTREKAESYIEAEKAEYTAFFWNQIQVDPKDMRDYTV